VNATWKDIALYALALALSLYTVMGDTVTLAWNPNPLGENVTNYTVYYGRSSGTYSDCATTIETNLTISLDPGRWYFMVLANNTIASSLASTEVVYDMPGILPVVVTLWIEGSRYLQGPWSNLTSLQWTSLANGFWRGKIEIHK